MLGPFVSVPRPPEKPEPPGLGRASTYLVHGAPNEGPCVVDLAPQDSFHLICREQVSNPNHMLWQNAWIQATLTGARPLPPPPAMPNIEHRFVVPYSRTQMLIRGQRLGGAYHGKPVPRSQRNRPWIRVEFTDELGARNDILLTFERDTLEKLLPVIEARSGRKVALVDKP